MVSSVIPRQTFNNFEEFIVLLLPKTHRYLSFTYPFQATRRLRNVHYQKMVEVATTRSSVITTMPLRLVLGIHGTRQNLLQYKVLINKNSSFDLVLQKRCKIFIYGGCKGNRNNFLSETQCLQRCDSDSNLALKTIEIGEYRFSTI